MIIREEACFRGQPLVAFAQMRRDLSAIAEFLVKVSLVITVVFLFLTNDKNVWLVVKAKKR